MLDIETLDSTPYSAVLAISAVPFDFKIGVLNKTLCFYRTISKSSNLEFSRSISNSTIRWWNKTNPELLRTMEEDSVDLRTAMIDFTEYLNHRCLPDFYIWSNGPDFDKTILESLYRTFKQQCKMPWKYNSGLCVRTMSFLLKEENKEYHTYLKESSIGTAHNALDDAYNQATYVLHAHKKLFNTQGILNFDNE